MTVGVICLCGFRKEKTGAFYSGSDVYVTLEGDEVSVVEVDVSELLQENVQGSPNGRNLCSFYSIGYGIKKSPLHNAKFSNNLQTQN
jgi:hypothetical protein